MTRNTIPSGPLRLRRYDTHIELVTVQHADALTTLTRDGVVYPDLTRSTHVGFPGFLVAYKWMAAELAARCSTPDTFNPETGAMFWLWAHTTRRSLAAQAATAAATEPSVLLRIRVPRNRVLLTDFQDWHIVLNHGVVWTEAETATFLEADETGEWYQTPLEQTLEASYGTGWRLDDLDVDALTAVQATWHHSIVNKPRRRGADTQACIAHLELSDIIDAVTL